MNERIRELAEQCTTIYNSTTFPVDKDFDHEKFAELIVKECAEICMKEFDTGLLMAPQAPWIAKQIKEHFGVEL
jgi:hypothetical protein